MMDYILAAMRPRLLGTIVMVLGALVGAATCGDAYGRAHAGEKP